jgi:hypothetical protein
VNVKAEAVFPFTNGLASSSFTISKSNVSGYLGLINNLSNQVEDINTYSATAVGTLRVV